MNTTNQHALIVTAREQLEQLQRSLRQIKASPESAVTLGMLAIPDTNHITSLLDRVERRMAEEALG